MSASARFHVIKWLLGLWLLSSGWGLMAKEEIRASEHLFWLIHQRLALMQQVALYKYQHQLPIYVSKMEKNVLMKVSQDATRLMLPVPETVYCFELQLQIARHIQQDWHQYWKTKGLPAHKSSPDIDKVLRPEIARLTTAIIEQLPKAIDELGDPACLNLLMQKIDQIIDVPFVNENHKHALLKSLIQIAESAADE